jgi:hypothetical protein
VPHGVRRAAARASPTLPSPANLGILVLVRLFGSGNVVDRRPLGASFRAHISGKAPGPPAVGHMNVEILILINCNDSN